MRTIDKIGNAPSAVRKEIQMTAGNSPLEPKDFPVSADGTAVWANGGQAIGEASDPAVVEDIAERLNQDDARHREHEWSA